MRTDFDFSPYYRATVGFDRVFDLLDSVASQAGAPMRIAIRLEAPAPAKSTAQAPLAPRSAAIWRPIQPSRISERATPEVSPESLSGQIVLCPPNNRSFMAHPPM